jgi:ABC-type Fe3+-hydroxamate transport system substrate-binding protein
MPSGAGRLTVDDRARPIALDRPARRIVSLAPSSTESLLAVGAGDRLIGVEEHSALPAGLATLPRVGGFKQVDVERVVALAPDLVLAAPLHAVSVAPRLEAHGVPVFVLDPRTVDGVVAGMARIAALAGVARAAAAYLATCRARVAAVVAGTLATRHRPLVYVECSPQGHTGGPGSFLHDLVAKAGGSSLGALARVEWPVLAPATVARHDPDVIVITRYPGSATAASVPAREGWERLSAVKSGRVHELPAGMLKRPGPELLDGLEQLAALVAAEGG